jgi:hypothetical protein
MASSNNIATRKLIERALRALKSSTHPDIQRLGLDVIAALPAATKIIAMLTGAGHLRAGPEGRRRMCRLQWRLQKTNTSPRLMQ